MPATPANTITPRRAIKNYQLSDLINLRYVALGPSRTLATGFGWKGKWTAWTVSAAGGTARDRRTSIYCMGLFAGDDQYIGAVISR